MKEYAKGGYVQGGPVDWIPPYSTCDYIIPNGKMREWFKDALDRLNGEVVDCEEETSDSAAGLEGLEVLQGEEEA